MHKQTNLFEKPFFGRGGDTSEAAAEKIAPKTQILRDKIVGILTFEGWNGVTPDEAAEMLNEDILNVRPRFTELKIQGKIVDSTKRRLNKKGNTQKVWVLA